MSATASDTSTKPLFDEEPPALPAAQAALALRRPPGRRRSCASTSGRTRARSRASSSSTRPSRASTTCPTSRCSSGASSSCRSLFHAGLRRQARARGKPNVAPLHVLAQLDVHAPARDGPRRVRCSSRFHLYEYWGQKRRGQARAGAVLPGALPEHELAVGPRAGRRARSTSSASRPCAFHFANGLWGFCFSWGITVSRRSQQLAASAFGVVGVVVLLLGLNTVIYFATGSRFPGMSSAGASGTAPAPASTPAAPAAPGLSALPSTRDCPGLTGQSATSEHRFEHGSQEHDPQRGRQGPARHRRRRRARRADDRHQALRGQGPGRPLLARAGQALALGVRAGRHQRERQHEGRGRHAAGAPRRDGLRRRLPRRTSRPSRAWPTRRRASSTCSTAWACPSTARPRACSTSAASAARSSTAPPSPARRPASSSSTRSTSRCAAGRPIDVEDEHGVAHPRREDGPQVRVLGLPPRSCSTTTASASARRAGPQDDGRSQSFPGDAVCLATGGCGIVFGRSTQQRDLHRHRRRAPSTSRAPATRTASSSRFTRPRSPAPTSSASSRESARGEGGRVWVPKDKNEQAHRRATSPRASATTSSSAMYPGYGNLVPRDIAARALFKKCFHEGRGVYNAEDAARTRTRSTSTSRTWTRSSSAKKLAGILEIYEKFVGDDPYKNPMQVFPAVHYSMGGLWVDFERDERRLARRPGSPRNQATNIPGLYAVGEVDYQYHGANRLGANSLLSCIWGGHGHAAPPSRRYQKNLGEERVRPAEVAPSRRPRSASRTKYERILKQNQDEGRREPVPAPPGARRDDAPRRAPSSATTTTLDEVLAKIDELDERVKRRRRRRTRRRASNQGAQFVRHLENMLVLARVIAQGARNRDESRGAHYKPAFPKRDDAELAPHDARLPRGRRARSKFVREFDYDARAGKRVHVTDAVDTSLVRAARAQVRAGGRGERRRDGQAGHPADAAEERVTMAEQRERDCQRRATQDAGALVHLRVRRQDGRDMPETRRWEEFEVPYQPQMNVISALMEIQKNPRDRRAARRSRRWSGRRPASKRCAARARWSSTAACGRRARRSSTSIAPERRGHHARADDASSPACAISSSIAARMFDDLKRVHAWIELDGTHELGPGPRESPEKPGGALPALALHDVRLLPRGVPAVSTTRRPSSAPRRSTRCASSTCTRAGRCTRTSASTR